MNELDMSAYGRLKCCPISSSSAMCAPDVAVPLRRYMYVSTSDDRDSSTRLVESAAASGSLDASVNV